MANSDVSFPPIPDFGLAHQRLPYIQALAGDGNWAFADRLISGSGQSEAAVPNPTTKRPTCIGVAKLWAASS